MNKPPKYTTFPRSKLFFPIFVILVLTGTLAGPIIAFAAERDGQEGTILFFGDSLTAGYDVNLQDAYPAVVERKVRDRGFEFHVVNAGLSGETTAGGLRRIDWILRREIDVFVLALGGNDALRGLDPREARTNLHGILEKVRDRYPAARLLLAGMKAPSNMGTDYAEAFAAIYPELAEEFGIPLIPFLLEGVAADPEYNLDDLIHPNEEGHRKIAQTVWKELEPLLDP